MSIRYSIVALILAIVSAGTVYELKYWVHEREGDLRRLERTVRDEQWRIRTLEADLAFLTRPERLALQAPQLGMVPVTPKALARLEELPRIDQIPVASMGAITSASIGGIMLPVPRPAR